ncbi:MAG: hypothetical protein GF398_07965 [Chitinivibrionales bacterium]|nr:hypothetical protein [Chitinivibrionales bacterium]
MQYMQSCRMRIIQPLPTILATGLFLFPALLAAQFDVTLLEGSAKIQRSQRKSWDDLQIGQQINDNDIVETNFQTKLTVQFGDGNIVILGSNSKLLLNISETESDGRPYQEVSLTLFGGGIFAKAVSNCHLSIYTANAVAQTEFGSLSAVADEKSGETGFQVLEGDVRARNIAQQQNRRLGAGQTSMVLPGKEPTAALYITNRHVGVLKHFFGDEYIDNQLASAGITPTDDRARQSRMSFSEGYRSRKTTGAQQKDGMYKRQFTMNKIYGGILRDQEQDKIVSKELTTPDSMFSNRGTVGFTFDMTIGNALASPAFYVTPAWKLKFMRVGLKLGLGRNWEGFTAYQFSGVKGILDIIDFVDFTFAPKRLDSLQLHLGGLQRLTIGNGVVVNGYANNNAYHLSRGLGFYGMGSKEDVKVQLFVGDLAEFVPLGIRIDYTPSVYYIGAGYYMDFDQHNPIVQEPVQRYTVDNSDADIWDTDSMLSNAHIYEINLATDILDRYDFAIRLGAEFAQKLMNWGDGFAVHAPYFDVRYRDYHFGAGFITETGRMMYGQFHHFYHSNRCRPVYVDSDVRRLVTQNTLFSPQRKQRSIRGFIKMSPWPGIFVSAEYRQDIFGDNTIRFKQDTVFTADDRKGISYSLRGSINNSLLKPIQFAQIYLEQLGGGVMPPGGSPFASWGFLSGLDVMTRPLIFNIAFEGGFSFYYLDQTNARAQAGRMNNDIDNGDNIFRLYLVARWGFL